MYQVVGADGEIYGPVDLETLREWTAEGRLSPLSSLIDPRTGRTFRAEELPELRPLFTPIAQQAPAMPTPRLKSPDSPYGSPQGNRDVTPVRGSDAVPYVTPNPKSMLIAVGLAIFLGMFGAHRFYLGYDRMGRIQLLITVLSLFVLAPVTILWGMVDAVLIYTGQLREANGRALTSFL